MLRTAAQHPRGANSAAFADHPALAEVIKGAVGLTPVVAVIFAVVAFALAGVVVARRGAGDAAGSPTGAARSPHSSSA